MPDNVATEIASAPETPALSETNWKGPGPVDPAAAAGENGGDAAPPSTEGKPAATQTSAAEGGEGEDGAAGEGAAAGEGEGGAVKDPPADPNADPNAPPAKAGRKRPTFGDRISELTASKKAAEQERDRALGLLEKA